MIAVTIILISFSIVDISLFFVNVIDDECFYRLDDAQSGVEYIFPADLHIVLRYCPLLFVIIPSAIRWPFVVAYSHILRMAYSTRTFHPLHAADFNDASEILLRILGHQATDAVTHTRCVTQLNQLAIPILPEDDSTDLRVVFSCPF